MGGGQKSPLMHVPLCGVSTNRLLDVWETLLRLSKYILSSTFSQNINYCSVAFSLLFSTDWYQGTDLQCLLKVKEDLS